MRSLLLAEFFPSGPPVRLTFWDASVLGPDSAVGAAGVTSPMALRRLLWAPGELGIGRAYVSGDLEIEGDLIGVLDADDGSSGMPPTRSVEV